MFMFKIDYPSSAKYSLTKLYYQNIFTLERSMSLIFSHCTAVIIYNYITASLPEIAKPLDPTARVRQTMAVVVFLVIATPRRKQASKPKPTKFNVSTAQIQHLCCIQC